MACPADECGTTRGAIRSELRKTMAIPDDATCNPLGPRCLFLLFLLALRVAGKEVALGRRLGVPLKEVSLVHRSRAKLPRSSSPRDVSAKRCGPSTESMQTPQLRVQYFCMPSGKLLGNWRKIQQTHSKWFRL